VAPLAATLAGALLVLFIVGPLLRLLLLATPGGIADALRDAELRDSIVLTIGCASAATVIGMALGTPLAWALARRRLPFGRAIEAFIELPMVVPHPVAGIALLLFLGRRTMLGAGLAAMGLEFVSHVPGIVAAMLFVSVPIMVIGTREAFATVDPRLERVARSLGDTPWQAFRRVTWPLSQRGMLAAAVLAWARSVSEFGAIVVLTYNPKVASILIFDRFTAIGLPGAVPASIILLLVALVVFGLVRLLQPTSRA
jgi:molybdate/tungstate transport system permease protein